MSQTQPSTKFTMTGIPCDLQYFPNTLTIFVKKYPVDERLKLKARLTASLNLTALPLLLANCIGHLNSLYSLTVINRGPSGIFRILFSWRNSTISLSMPDTVFSLNLSASFSSSIHSTFPAFLEGMLNSNLLSFISNSNWFPGAFSLCSFVFIDLKSRLTEHWSLVQSISQYL